MEKSEAFRIFGLEPTDSNEDIQSGIEEHLFALKKDIMQKYMVPMLLKKKLASLEPFMAAEEVLLHSRKTSTRETPRAWAGKPADSVSFLREYEAYMSNLKLALMNAQSYADVGEIVEQLILTQEYYMALFRLFFADFSVALPEEVNTREMIDTGVLLHSLTTGGPDNKTMLAIEMELARIEKIRKLS